MSIYTITHTTKYKYAGKVGNSANQIILFPKSGENQKILEQQLTISPEANIDYFSDYFENRIGVFSILDPHDELIILSELRVETHSRPFPVVNIPAQEQWQELKDKTYEDPFIDFLQAEKFDCQNEVRELLGTLVSKDKSILDCVQAISAYINANFQYKQGVTTVETQIDEIWENRLGVCQDFAHMMIAMLRLVGIPARYVSGYICPSRGVEMRGEGATHAWVEVYIPTYGWQGNDPTNNCWVNDKHVKIAFGRDFRDCTPIKGTYEGTSSHNLHVSVVIHGDDGSKSGLTEEEIAEKESATIVTVVEENVVKSNPLNSYQLYIQQQQQQQQ